MIHFDHFCLNSIQNIIQYFFPQNIQSKNYSMTFLSGKFNSKIDSKIWIWLYSIQQNIYSFRKPGYRRPLLVRVFAHLQLDLGSRHVDLRGAWAGEVVRISKTTREPTSLRWWWSWVLSQLVTEERLRRFAPQVDLSRKPSFPVVERCRYSRTLANPRSANPAQIAYRVRSLMFR